jgi:hypothetical protein
MEEKRWAVQVWPREGVPYQRSWHRSLEAVEREARRVARAFGPRGCRVFIFDRCSGTGVAPREIGRNPW